jgi:serine/threonine-protein kinase
VERFGPVNPGRAIHLLRQMCDSLADAHANGLLHRDIKPANIFVCRVGQQTDFVKILDFGLVKSVVPEQENLALTAEQAVLGTPAFIAPEAIGGPRPDHRLDLYSLGCVGYWLLTGCLVFPSASALAMAVAHAKEEPIPPSTRSELEIPAELDQIILDCLAKNPEDRPQSAADLAARLVDCPCPDPWTAQEAASWWETHLPQLGAVHEPAQLFSTGRDLHR